MPDRIRMGVVGLGNMGQMHCRLIRSTRGLQLAAVCDVDAGRLERTASEYGCAAYPDAVKLLGAGVVDAVLIATPHYDHTTIGIQALKAGLHVLVEKPISVHKADCEKLIRAHQDRNQVFAAMFNQRTDRHYQRIRDLVHDGTLGEIRRISWTITDWFRSQAYYDSGGWRATWAGEGGGVLLNQCPHQLDLLQWMFGMPTRLYSHCGFGKYHDIEVEDEVATFLQYANGATGVFATSTGEAPGINRLEVAAEQGLLVYEAGKPIVFFRNAGSVSRAIAENKPFEKPASTREIIKVSGRGRQHAEILDNFSDAIRLGTPLIAPAAEGIHSVELANAMLLSSLKSAAVEMPISGRVYRARLKNLVAGSRYRKPVSADGAAEPEDLSKTF